MFRDPLDERAADAVELLRSLPDRARVSLLADADIDGIASAALLSKAFLRTRTRFHVRLTRRRDEAMFKQVFAQEPDLVLTADFGSTTANLFLDARVPAIICDHHVPSTDGHGKTLAHLNPHLVGEDGSRTASGAAVSWVFAKAWLGAHGLDATDLAGYALLGAHGDRYHGGDVGGIHGRIRAATGGPKPAAAGLDHIEPDPNVKASVVWHNGPGLASGPLHEALANSLDPFLIELAGRPDAAADELRKLGIDPVRPIGSLDKDQHRRFASWLTLTVLGQGAEAESVTRMLEPVPAYPRYEGMAVHTLAELVDAACREDVATEGLIGLLGNDRDRAPLIERVETYKGRIRQALEAAVRDEEPKRFGPATFCSVHDGSYAGPVGDRLMAWTTLGRGPLIVGGPMGSRGFKISLRARPPTADAKQASGPRKMTTWKLDEAAQRAARAVQGVGGGHGLAAGAVCEIDSAEELLMRLGAELGKQAAGPNLSEEQVPLEDTL